MHKTPNGGNRRLLEASRLPLVEGRLPRKVLVVCHGNINRSALCAAVLRKHASKGIKIDSAGLKARSGAPAAKKTRDAAQALGYDLAGHRARVILLGDVYQADVVVYMDGGNLRRLQKGFFPWEHKFVCLGQFAEPPVSRIPDPAYVARSSPEFRRITKLVVNASKNLARQLS